jgi:hypothetical protein
LEDSSRSYAPFALFVFLFINFVYFRFSKTVFTSAYNLCFICYLHILLFLQPLTTTIPTYITTTASTTTTAAATATAAAVTTIITTAVTTTASSYFSPCSLICFSYLLEKFCNYVVLRVTGVLSWMMRS